MFCHEDQHSDAPPRCRGGTAGTAREASDAFLSFDPGNTEGLPRAVLAVWPSKRSLSFLTILSHIQPLRMAVTQPLEICWLSAPVRRGHVAEATMRRFEYFLLKTSCVDIFAPLFSSEPRQTKSPLNMTSQAILNREQGGEPWFRTLAKKQTRKPRIVTAASITYCWHEGLPD